MPEVRRGERRGAQRGDRASFNSLLASAWESVPGRRGQNETFNALPLTANRSSAKRRTAYIECAATTLEASNCEASDCAAI